MAIDPNNYWEQLERLEKLIRASELKAGVIFSFHSVILGLFVDRMDHIQPVFDEHSIFIVISALWLVSVLISIFYCFKCFMPRIESQYTKNVFFFRDAAYKFGSMEEYSKILMDICSNEQELTEKLSNQIYVESLIIDKKFSAVQMSIRFFALSFFFIILMVIFWVSYI